MACMVAVGIVYAMLSGFARLGYVEKEVDFLLIVFQEVALEFSNEQ
jgi:hypothetical protein